ncbi:MAG: hypothetical protein ACI306_07795 [Muribaculaceae bacterium]
MRQRQRRTRRSSTSRYYYFDDEEPTPRRRSSRGGGGALSRAWSAIVRFWRTHEDARVWIIGLLVFAAVLKCVHDEFEADKQYDELADVEERVGRLEELIAKADTASLSDVEVSEALQLAEEIEFDYDGDVLTDKGRKRFEAMRERIAAVKAKTQAQLSKNAGSDGVSVVRSNGMLIEGRRKFPVYLKSGEELRLTASSYTPFTLKLVNADTRRELCRYASVTEVKDTFSVEFDAVYVIEISMSETDYVKLDINYQVHDRMRALTRTCLEEQHIESTKDNPQADKVNEIELVKVFTEPRKLTLRGQLKSMFAGNCRALVAVPVPVGATDILYSLRIDTSEKGYRNDGKFHDSLCYTYTKVKFLGLPVYEKTKGGGGSLIAKLLDDNRPLRDEDAYCNMYVFYNQSEAKAFQDVTKPIASQAYDVEYSTLGTQSCNGCIPTKGHRTIYLAFENERVRYNNYIWVEIDAVIPTTKYYLTKYVVMQ